ncbi:MAG: GNAT family N-acetyltransferase [Bacteroidales bacterium]|jgi:GNAT superfamily N-acetyltransferase|nr:GNAT family N-acetyltransferase [Bacteroidales bacterium]
MKLQSLQFSTYALAEPQENETVALIEQTYIEAFPKAERRDFLFVKDEPRFAVYVFYYEGQYVGFITAWTFDLFVFVEHFAIDKSFRGRGLGGLVMKLFMCQTPLPLVLEVELPKDEQSVRRIDFYKRLCFVVLPQEYSQPPYRNGDEWLPMHLMAYPDVPFEDVKRVIHRVVYGVREVQ